MVGYQVNHSERWSVLILINDVTSSHPVTQSRWLNWFSLLVTIALVVGSLYYLNQHISFDDIWQIVVNAQLRYVFLTFFLLFLTLMAKAWRWQILMSSGTKKSPFIESFWALMLGQQVNLLVPMLRLGEVARIFAINSQTGINKTLTLSTLVVEKFLDLVILGVTVLLLIATAVFLDTVSYASIYLSGIALVALVLLYGMAQRPLPVIKLTEGLTSWMPDTLQTRLVGMVKSGLEGLGALRNGRLLIMSIVLSVIIGILMVLTPYVLFPAFNIPFGLTEATLIHVVVILALVPPSTPGKLVIFDGAVAFSLAQSGLQDKALIVSYALMLHFILVAPQILLGIIAASRTKWHWKLANE